MNDKSVSKLNEIIENNPVAAGVATGFGLTVLLSEPKELVLTSGRLVTSIFQKRFQQQLANELLDLAKKGGLKEKPYEDESIISIFLMLQKEIDENPDQIARLNAMKALFIASVGKETSQAELIMIHQLAQKAKNLNSMDLIVSKTCFYKVYKDEDAKYHNIIYANEWRRIIKELNNGNGDFLILVAESEKRLINYGLLNDALGVSKENIQPGRNFRLSDLGISLCVFLEKYDKNSFAK